MGRDVVGRTNVYRSTLKWSIFFQFKKVLRMLIKGAALALRGGAARRLVVARSMGASAHDGHANGHGEEVGFGNLGGPQGDTDKQAWSEAWARGEPAGSSHIEPIFRGTSYCLLF